MSEALRVFSFGGGVQSTAALVLQAQGKMDFPVFVFCNVGADSENPATLEYIEQYAKPYAEKHGIELIEVALTMVRGANKGRKRTLLERVQESERSVPIPVRLQSGAFGNRTCTADYKIKQIAKWTKAHGATKDNPALVGIGISVDEIHRANNRTLVPHERGAYPLIELGLSRRDCLRIIQEAGLPTPPKSSCWFCPFRRPSEWRELKRTEPVLFDKAVQLEQMINVRRLMLGRDKVYLHASLQPLDQATAGDQLVLDGMFDNCESGYCMT